MYKIWALVVQKKLKSQDDDDRDRLHFARMHKKYTAFVTGQREIIMQSRMACHDLRAIQF